MSYTNTNTNTNNKEGNKMYINDEIMNKVKDEITEQANKPITIDNVVEPIITKEEYEKLNCKVPPSVKRSWEMKVWDKKGFVDRCIDIVGAPIVFQNDTHKLPCLCGSGKKFKKCCRPVLRRMQTLLNRIECNHITKDDVVKSEKIPYRISWKNLPTEYRNVVEKFITENPISEGSCWYVSHHLATLHPDIKIVNGFYGGRVHDVHLESYQREIKQYNTHLLGKKVWDCGVRGTSARLVFDTDGKIAWMKHSWNYIEGGAKDGGDLYFDVTGEFWDVINWQHSDEMLEERTDEGKKGEMEDMFQKHTKDCIWTNFLVTEKLDISSYERSGWNKDIVNGYTRRAWNYFLEKKNKCNHNPLWEGVDKDEFEKTNNIDFDRTIELWNRPNFRKVA